MTEIILTSSILILILTVLRRLLRGRISPTLQYALWILVAARLLIPGTLFPAPVSAVGIADDLYNSIISTETEQTAPQPPENDLPDVFSPLPPVIAPTEPTVPSPVPSTTPTVSSPHINWIDLIWKLGIAVTGVVLIVSNLTFYRTLRKERQRISPDELPIRCTVPVYHVASLSSPCLFGLHPAIYVNTEALSEPHFRHILVHEQTHLRHGDHIWALVRCLCLALHWYHPLVWLAAALARRDCELSCDSAAIRSLGEDQRIHYGETLVAMLSSGRSPMLQAATTMSGSKRTMLERLDLIVHRPHMLRSTLAVVAVVTLCAVLFTFGGYTDQLTKDMENRVTLPETDDPSPAPEPESQDTAPEPLRVHYTHYSDLFSLSLSEVWLETVTTSESEDGVSFYTTDRSGAVEWLLSITPQPSDWVHHSTPSIPLASFDTNGTPQTYSLSYNSEQSDPLSAQIESLADSFQLLATPEQFSELVYSNCRENLPLAIAYLPYLNWQNYRDTYGSEELSALLSALWRFADSGVASWDQYHDLLSMTDVGLDGAYAEGFASILQAMYQRNEEQFLSVLSSVYITDTERERVAAYVNYPPTSEPPAIDSMETNSSDTEIILGLSRGYSPTVWSTGSPVGLTVNLTGDWTLEGIRGALFTAVAEHISGTPLDGDLRSIDIAYSFRFPDEMHDGVTFTVPFYASYLDQEVCILPSGTPYSIGGRTSELTATICLVGEGITAPVDEEFAAGQAVYARLAECVAIPDGITVSAQEESFDIPSAVQSVIEANLLRAGLSDLCRLTSISLGGYQNPVWCSPGYEQNISCTVSFLYANENNTQQFTCSGNITVTTVE